MDVQTKKQVVERAAKVIDEHVPDMYTVIVKWRISHNTQCLSLSSPSVRVSIWGEVENYSGKFANKDLTHPTPESIAVATKEAFEKLPDPCSECGRGDDSVEYTDDLHRHIIDIFDELGVGHG